MTGAGSGGLGTLAARWSFVLVWACAVARGVIERPAAVAEPLSALAFAAGLAGGLILTTRSDEPLDRIRAAVLTPITLFLVVAALSAAPTVGDVWAFDLAIYLTAFLTARGNPLAGLVGSGAVIGYAVWWALPQDPTLTELGLLLGIPVGCVVAGIVWRATLVRLMHRDRAHRSAADRAADRARATTEAVEASRAELAAIGATAVPLLMRIAAGGPVDDELRGRLAQAEASIRDRIRAPHLQNPILVDQISALRERGVTVVLLGEEAGPWIANDLARVLASLIAPVTAGRVTVRTIPAGRTATASVVVQQPAGTEQILLDADGREVGRG